MVFVGQNFRCTVIQEPNYKYNSSNNIFLPGWMEKICQESSHSLVIDVSTNNYELSAIRLIFSSVPIMKKKHTYEKCMESFNTLGARMFGLEDFLA